MAMLEMRMLDHFSSSERSKNLGTLSAQTTSQTAFGRASTTVSGVSGKTSASTTAAHSHASSGTHRKHRSRSTTRCEEKPKKKKHHLGSGSTSLVSIPNAIKLSMLNSGLMSFAAENGVVSTIPLTPTPLKNFPKLCEQRRKFTVLYKVEFQTAVKVETHSCRHATKAANKEKNQNHKCIPYDYNRVVLNAIDDTPDSDYINASYVDSLLKPNAYIVTQGPTESTVQQFWRMVWQEKASCIVMLTKTFDFIKVMCVQYWPAAKDKSELYGDLEVQILHEEELANFHIRTIRLIKINEQGESIEERTLLQFHYTEWHSHSCPFSNALLEFRRRVRSVIGTRLSSATGPMIVHCNDGGGRSGVYLSIDANLELAEEEDCFNVFGYLKKLRQSRKGLIENVDQYKFVYDTLEEFVVCGVTWFPVKDLSNRLKQKSMKNPISKINEYKREFQQICKLTPRFTIGDCAGGHRGDNHEKNRDVLMVPPDNFRPYLTSFQGNSFTDYINAVFVDGYTKPREYIVTEWPLKHTCGEFWSLVYDYECSAVVILCVPPKSSQNFPSFWPEGRHSKKYGPVFTIDHISHNHYTNIKSWIFRINKKIVSLTELMAGVKAPAKTVQLFQLMCWPMGHKVPTSTNSLVELMNMVERWRQRTDYGPVAVVSPDGRSRCGVYCAANACIEQVIQHGEVDVFQAVKTVRRHRPQLIENMLTELNPLAYNTDSYSGCFVRKRTFTAGDSFGRGIKLPLTPEDLSGKDSGKNQSRIDEVSHHPGSYSFKTEMRMSLYRKNIFAGPTRLPRRIPDLKDESAELDEDLRWGEFKLMKCSRKALEEQEETISECSVASSKKSSGESCSKKEAIVTGSSENSEFTVAKTSWRSESEETLNDKKLVTAAGWSESTMEPEEEKEEGQEDEEGQEQEKQEELEQQEKQLEQEEVEEPEEENSKLMELRVLSKQERIENFRKSKRLWNHGSRRFEETDPQNKYKSFEDVLQEPPSTRLKEEVGLPLHLSREVSIDRYPLSRLEKILDSFDTDPFAKDFESFCDAVMFGKRKEGSTSNEKGGNPDPQIHKMNEISDKILSEGPIKLKRKDELSQKLKCLLL